MGVTGNYSALHKLQDDLRFVGREAATSAADAVGAMLVENIHRASVRVSGPSIEIRRYLPRAAYLAPRLEKLSEDVIDRHLAEMLDGSR